MSEDCHKSNNGGVATMRCPKCRHHHEDTPNCYKPKSQPVADVGGALPEIHVTKEDLDNTAKQLAGLDGRGYSGLRDNMVRMSICDLLDNFNCRERQLKQSLAENAELRRKLATAEKRFRLYQRELTAMQGGDSAESLVTPPETSKLATPGETAWIDCKQGLPPMDIEIPWNDRFDKSRVSFRTSELVATWHPDASADRTTLQGQWKYQRRISYVNTKDNWVHDDCTHWRYLPTPPEATQ